MKNRVVFGITGGIAVVKIPEVLQLLAIKKIDLEVILSDAAASMIPEKQIEATIQKKVYRALFSSQINTKNILANRHVEHIDIADSAKLFVIVPATANIIAKLAQGVADDYITTVALAVRCPILIFPSMNVHMWAHPVTQENIKKLRSIGYIVFEPDSGMLACGYKGKGKLPKPKQIVEEIEKLVHRPSRLKGKKIIVTAGGTQEPIDAVRFIANASSGKMGAAIAEAVWLQGAEVLFVCSQESVRPRYQMKEEVYNTADELEMILKKTIPHYDVIFHSAAVSDFVVKNFSKEKISSAIPVDIHLIPREKILNKIKKWNPDIQLFAFKAAFRVSEKELIHIAQEKLWESQADAVIANDVGKKDRGFGVDTNEVTIVTKAGENKYIPLSTKVVVAEKIVAYLLSSRTE